jgi:hypothetical protein
MRKNGFENKPEGRWHSVGLQSSAQAVRPVRLGKFAKAIDDQANQTPLTPAAVVHLIPQRP